MQSSCVYFRPVIQKRMNRYAAGEIHFNLMAIVADQKLAFENKISDLTDQLAAQQCQDNQDMGN